MYALIDIDPDFAHVQFGDEETLQAAFRSSSSMKSEGSLHLVRVDDPSKFSFYHGRDLEVEGGEVVEAWEAEW